MLAHKDALSRASIGFSKWDEPVCEWLVAYTNQSHVQCNDMFYSAAADKG